MDFKTRLLRFYKEKCPSKCSDVDMLAIKYKTKEKELFRQLTFKYGPEAELSNADKTAIRNSTMKPDKKKEEPTKKQMDVQEWMNSLLNDKDKALLNELDNYSGTKLPQSILDKI